MERVIPIYVLSGFLGSGKTTLLTAMMDDYRSAGLRPAVVMNELGDVNLDGLLLDEQLPMAELLSGCICCSVQGDLGLTIKELVDEEQPDAIWIEATGVASPAEIIDAITEASLYMKVAFKRLITVVDARHLLDQLPQARSATRKLMEAQVRHASIIVLNKVDRLQADEIDEAEQALRMWNKQAPIEATVRAYVDRRLLGLEWYTADHAAGQNVKQTESSSKEKWDYRPSDTQRAELEKTVTEKSPSPFHQLHQHVTVYTHYLDHALDRVAFHGLFGKLPSQVHRAKGIVQFTDGPELYMFQYAYHELELLKIAPSVPVPNVLVFIGDAFSQASVQDLLK